MDRRGRGQSGDTLPYVAEHEFEDVAALVDSIPGTVRVLRHSYGALCSLEATLLTPRIHKLILNEPPMYTTTDISYPEDSLDRYDALLRAGDAERALLMLYEVGQTPADEVHMLQSQPNWQARVAAAHTIPREVLAVRDYAADPARFRSMSTPILFLLGGETLPIYTAATQALHRWLPHSQIVVLPGQPHDAVVTAPDLVSREVLHYFLDAA
ncbi:MAG: alpha/beta fold hydrolase [Sphaerobacter thermophilus]|uniref:alpha/beta fold hydrolase n=1 Tax=Sphaerobacter thermophilus TaxID=2057 RepID=UPI000322F71F|nr:alpha/beta fold hydrolase [Sphaerobacter thermophilus]PZN60297.1 MAG: alpha/beta hydrolase [Sphaerobacter thermophilus]